MYTQIPQIPHKITDTDSGDVVWSLRVWTSPKLPGNISTITNCPDSYPLFLIGLYLSHSKWFPNWRWRAIKVVLFPSHYPPQPEFFYSWSIQKVKGCWEVSTSEVRFPRLSLAVTSLTQGRSQETGSSVEKYAQDLQPSLTSIQNFWDCEIRLEVSAFIIRVLVFPVSSQAGNITNTGLCSGFWYFQLPSQLESKGDKAAYKRYPIQSKSEGKFHLCNLQRVSFGFHYRWNADNFLNYIKSHAWIFFPSPLTI